MAVTPIATVPVGSARVQFGEDVPEVVRSEILLLWPRLAWLLPRWLRTLTIHWKATADDEESAQCAPDYTYGYAAIIVTALWIDDRERVKLHDLIHEILHLWIAPVADYAELTFATLLKDEAPKFHKTVKAELERRVETAIQDMAEVLTARILAPEAGRLGD